MLLKLLLMWKKAKNILIMNKLGLLGKGIQHSKSKSMYEGLLNRKVDYHLFDYETDLEIPDLHEFFKTVEGLSITAPYKEHFLNDVDLSPEVKKLHAINCIRKTKNGFEFNLLFSNNGFITLSSEIIEVTLEDLKEIKNDL